MIDNEMALDSTIVLSNYSERKSNHNRFLMSSNTMPYIADATYDFFSNEFRFIFYLFIYLLLFTTQLSISYVACATSMTRQEIRKVIIGSMIQLFNKKPHFMFAKSLGFFP